MIKKAVGIVLFISGVFVTASLKSIEMTGNTISQSQVHFSLLEFIGPIILFISLFLLASRKSLDAMIIPTGKEDELRAEVAGKNKDKLKDKGYYIISGVKDTLEYPDSHRYRMFQELKKQGINPAQITYEGKSINTKRNLLYSLKRIKEIYERHGRKGPIDVGIVSYPGHLRRFYDFYRQAIKEGLFKKGDFRIHKIRTKESLPNKLHEINPIVRYFHNYQIKTMKKDRGDMKSDYPPIIRFLGNLRRRK